MFSQTPAGQPQGSRVHQCSLNIWSLSITFQHLFHWNFVEKQPTTWLKKESSLTRYWKCIEEKLMLRGNWAVIERPLMKYWVYSMFSLVLTSTIAPYFQLRWPKLYLECCNHSQRKWFQKRCKVSREPSWWAQALDCQFWKILSLSPNTCLMVRISNMCVCVR